MGTKTVIVADTDAYRIIRDMRNAQVPLEPAPIPDIRDIAHSRQDLAQTGALDLAEGNEPLHVLVPKGSPHTRSKAVAQHVWDGDLPPAGLLKTEQENVLVQSPPFAAAMLARHWPLSWLTMYVCEMCCDVSVAGDSENFLQREAVSSTADFKDLVPAMRGRYGAKNFRKAVMAAGDGCASPLEFQARAVLCLPVDDGAFGTGAATSNLRVAVCDPDGTHHVRYLDLGWETTASDGHVVIKGVEVDGGQHNRNEIRTDDHVRSYELRSSDVEELRCNSHVFDSLARITKFGEGVRHMLGLPPIRMTKQRTRARSAFVQSLDESPWKGLRLLED